MSLLDVTKKGLAIGLSVQMVLTFQLSTMAQAEMLTTEAAISKYAAYQDREFLMGELRTDEVKNEMIRLGVDPAEAEARLAALSDDEVASMVRQMDADSAGAGGLVGALLTVFVILLVTDLLCLTRVFRFTRCGIR